MKRFLSDCRRGYHRENCDKPVSKLYHNITIYSFLCLRRWSSAGLETLAVALVPVE